MGAKKIAIVGAGVGGLATAARLSHSGYDVAVYEKLSQCGGRCNVIEDKGFSFDIGPSFVLMPDFFHEVFQYCDAKLEDYLDLRPLEVNYKIFYPDGTALTVYPDRERKEEELEKIEPHAAKHYRGFFEETEAIYQSVEPLLYTCFSKKELLNPSRWPLIGKLRVFDSWYDLAAKYFTSEKLRYAFSFESLFLGVSPFDAPAFYSIINYSEQVQKVLHSMGGMYKIPQALEQLSQKNGASIHYNSAVERIAKNGNGFALSLAEGEGSADSVVVGADYSYALSDLLGRPTPKFRSSCSVYLLFLGLKRKLNTLAHHNLFFPEDVKKNMRQIFVDKVIPEDPAFYVHVPTVTDSSLAPEGKDILYLLVLVPNLSGGTGISGEDEERLRRFVMEKINRVEGADVEDLIEVEHRFYPKDFIGRYNIKHGATFGLAHTMMQSAFFRPTNFDRKTKGLYYVGASTQPGGGLPPVIASSKITAELIKAASPPDGPG